MIEIKNLSLSYDKKVILKDISLKTENKFISIIGPNGSGKSTLLKIISQTINNYDGEVFINNKNLRNYNKLELAKLRAFVSPNESILNNFLVKQYISFGRAPFQKLFGILEDHDQKIINETMNNLSVSHLSDNNIQSLSSGEFQKIQLARALVQEPKLLLLDEPTSHLDINHQIAIMKKLRELSESGITVMIIIHDINLAIAFSDEIIILKEGQILSNGSPENTITAINLKNTFGNEWEIYNNPLRIFPKV